MKNFREILKRVLMITGIVTVITATVPDPAYADPPGGDGEEQLPDPPSPKP